MNFENIHIGELIKQRVNELGIPVERICNFMNANEIEIKHMYEEEFLSSGAILRWSKLLEYDFFRIYSQHLILYSPPSGDCAIQKSTVLPVFRKNIYTKEMIEFILELLKTGKKSTQQVIDDYKIPRSTLHKWIVKYNTYEK